MVRVHSSLSADSTRSLKIGERGIGDVEMKEKKMKRHEKQQKDEELQIENSSTIVVLHERPSSHLCWSVLSTLCCVCSCLTLFCSIPALNYSFKTVDDLESGDMVKAGRHSKIARKFNTFATVFWLLGLITFIITIVLAYLLFTGKLVQIDLPSFPSIRP